MTKLIAGNWKMFLTAEKAVELARALAETKSPQGVERLICPPFVHIDRVRAAIAGSDIALGAQNCAGQGEGALTGEVCASMLPDYGCRYVILGHSERRAHFAEDNALLSRKLSQVHAAALIPIFCVGETETQRMAGETNSVLDHQLQALEGYAGGEVVIAYEPVWAIGTGKVASIADIESAHAHIAATARGLLGTGVAVRVLYGGSVKPDNAPAILRAQGVDGALVGGASLKAADFAGIVGSAC